MPPRPTQDQEHRRGQTCTGQLVAFIQSRTRAFADTALALERLKRIAFPAGTPASFAAFCLSNFGFSRKTVRRYLIGAGVINGLEASGFTDLPDTEAQTRQLGMLRDARPRGAAWRAALRGSRGTRPSGGGIVREKVMEQLRGGARPTKPGTAIPDPPHTFALSDGTEAKFSYAGGALTPDRVAALLSDIEARFLAGGFEEEAARAQRAAVGAARALNRAGEHV